MIFTLVMLGAATAVYIVFSPSFYEFQTVQNSLFSLLKLLAGDFRVIAKMQTIEPIFATLFFIYFLIVCLIFLTNIFIGVVVCHFNQEMELLALEHKFSGKVTRWRNFVFNIFQ